MPSVATYLDATARRRPGAVAAVHASGRFTYAQLARLVNRTANGLKALGYGPGDVIALVCPNRPGFIVAYYAILKIGATAAILSTGLKRRDLTAELGDSGARAALVFDGFGDTGFAELAVEVAGRLDGLERLWVIPSDPRARSPLDGVPALRDLMAGQPERCATVERAEDAVAQLIFTSGSTGRNKGVEVTHASLAAMVEVNRLCTRRADTAVRLAVSPFFHIMGQTFGLNLAVLCAETMVLVDAFDPERVRDLIVRERATHLVCMPIYYRKLLDLAPGPWERALRSSLRLCGTGGGPLPHAWAEEFRDRLGLPLTPGYGLTEAGGLVSWHAPGDPVRCDSVGLPAPGVELRLATADGRRVAPGQGEAAEGEVLVRSPGLMKGYRDRPADTAAAFVDGWLRTGDIGSFDRDGYLYIRGRISGRIIRGHEHVYPAEIEGALAGHPMVSAAAAVPVPHELLGQDIKTIVVLRRGAHLRPDDLLSWLQHELPEGKAPGIIEIRDDLPVTQFGKVQLGALA